MTFLAPLTYPLSIEELRPEDTPRGRFCFHDIADLVGRQSYRLAMCPWPPCPSSESPPMDLVFAPSQIESWPIARLRPYARNAKTHGADQVAKSKHAPRAGVRQP